MSNDHLRISSSDSVTLTDSDDDSDVAREEEELRRLEQEIAEIERETAKMGPSMKITLLQGFTYCI